MLTSLLVLALQAGAPAAAPPQQAAAPPIQGLIRLFDVVCNQAFPDDQKLIAAMAQMSVMRPLTPADLRLYLKSDAGRGWYTMAGPARIIITLEAPPYHACGVRMAGTDGVIDDALWRSVIDAAQARAGGGFTRLPAQTIGADGMRSSAAAEVKRNQDGSAEAFYLIRSTLTDPAKAPGFRTEVRMVHQLAAAGTASAPAR